MKTIIFATNNQHKINEIKFIVGSQYQIVSLKDAGIDIDIPEPYDTLKENAFAKSSTIYKLTQQNCFSEDTGLFVEALTGEPGVRSARYAGEENDPLKNMEKLLKNLVAETNRSAQFITVISLILDGVAYLFEGVCRGLIIDAPKGTNGFGYDPIFIPDGAEKTFAEMTNQEKSLFSHRQKATAKLVAFLSQNWKLPSLN